MRRALLAAPAIAVALLSVPAWPAEEDAVTELIRDALALFNAQDPQLFEHVHPDFEAFFGVATPLLIDREEYVARVQGMWNTFPRVRQTQETESVRVHGDTAVVNGYFTFTVFTEEGGASTQGGRSTMVFVKEGGRWMAHTFHFSGFFES